jgi:hypothetical protein
LYTIANADGNGYSYSYKVHSDSTASTYFSTAPVALFDEKETHCSVRKNPTYEKTG